MPGRKTGVMGGTFNPIHNSHLYVAEACRDALELDRILLVPTYTPPHKEAWELADAHHRLAMCRLAAGRHGLEACGYEVESAGTSYTWKTLAYLQEQCPEDSLFLLMGADMFLTVQDWRRPREIYSRAVLCAVSREEGERDRLLAHSRLLEGQGARCRVLPVSPRPLSSTGIREAIRRGDCVSGSLPPAVWEYIAEHGLYGAEERGRLDC